MAHIIATLFPVFAVLALGYALARKTFLSRTFLNELNRFVYYVALPALMINSVAGAEALPPQILPALAAYISATVGTMALAFLNARLLGLKRWQFGTFIQAAFRGNIAFIGLPILVYALRNEPPETASGIVAQGVFIFAPMMIFYNIFSVIFLIGSQDSNPWKNLPKTFRNILTNPLVLAALLGIVLFLLPVDLPGPAMNTLEFIGRTAAPCALICVGGGIAVVSMQGRYRSATFSSILKTAATPLLVYLISRPFGLSESTTLIIMIYAATPTAVASYVMAKEMKGDEAMASGGIVISTVLSVVSLGVIVGLFGF
jgi:predicted permease